MAVSSEKFLSFVLLLSEEFHGLALFVDVWVEALLH